MFRIGKIILNFPSIHILRFLGVLCVFGTISFSAAAQNKTDSSDFAKGTKITDTVVKNDSTIQISKNDTLAGNSALEQKLGIRISQDALTNVVVATATDSAVMDIKSNDFRLYGDAKVDYDGRKLSADEIDFNQSSNVATATEVKDSTRKKSVAPTFEQGSEKFTYDHLQYNFKSQRAIVRNANSQYGEGFVRSEQIKRNSDQSLYGYRNIYTTCSLPHPHFGIRTNKIKIIPDQAIAMGSANIEIEGVPTPLFLPFGFFPINSEKHRSGFILPGYVVEQQRGLGFTKGGYYFYLNDYADLELKTDIYTKGSYAAYVNSTYVNKYKYNGNVFLSYSVNKVGDEFEKDSKINKDYAIKWTHYKDAKSLPGVSFNASVDIRSQNFNALNTYNASQMTQNIFQSNVTYTKSWVGKPYSFTAAATHSQNTATKDVSITLPNITFYIMPQNVFQRKNMVGSARWYEKISVGYNLKAQNRLDFNDTAFQLSKLQFSNLKNGMIHNIPITASYNALRFINITFNATYNEYWNTSKLYNAYNDATKKLDTTIQRGFETSRDFNAGISFNTQIYGMKLFKKGAIRGFRHRLSPTVGLSFRPDFAKAPFYYAYQSRLDSSQRLYYSSPYVQSIVGYPSVPGRNGVINFGLDNNLQMKVRSSKDTATGYKNISLLDGLSINTSYNLAADSFQWSPIAIAARTNILNKFSVSANANFSPYQYDYVNNRLLPRTTLAAGQGIARLTNAAVALSTSFRSKSKGNRDQNPATQTEDYKSLMRNNGYNNYVDFNVPWTVNLNYSLSLTKQASVYSHTDTSILSQNIMVNGDVNLSPRWKVSVYTGYNLSQKQVAPTQVNLYRDLHCWEMTLGLIPFGIYRSFNFALKVKAQVLQDLKLTKHRDFRDTVN